MYKQLNFIRNTDLRNKRHHVLSLPVSRSIEQNYQAFKTELLRSPQITHVTSATNRPTQVGSVNPVYWEGRGPDQYETFNFIWVDYDFIKTFEMSIVEGRDFSRAFPTDRQGYREFILLLILANAIAWPAAYMLMCKLLQTYAYRTSITLWIFLLVGALACVISLMTVSFQAVKATWTDPTRALRY